VHGEAGKKKEGPPLTRVLKAGLAQPAANKMAKRLGEAFFICIKRFLGGVCLLE